MNAKEVEARGLERLATLLEKQADDREATAAASYGGGSYLYFQSLEAADERRVRARAMRVTATRLRRHCR